MTWFITLITITVMVIIILMTMTLIMTATLWTQHYAESRADTYTSSPHNSPMREVLALPHFTDEKPEAPPAPGPVRTHISGRGEGAVVRKGEGSLLWCCHASLEGFFSRRECLLSSPGRSLASGSEAYEPGRIQAEQDILASSCLLGPSSQV